MAKTVSLTIGERAKSIELLNSGQFSNSVLAIVLDDLKNLAVTEDEWQKANLVKTANPDNTELWTWDEKYTKDIQLDNATVGALLGFISKKSEANELTIQDAPVLSLETKLTA